MKECETKNFKFPAVFPMVFYIGSGKWTVSMSLKEMFDGYESFGNYLINFSYALVDVKGYDDGVKDFRSRLLKVMMILEQAKHFEGILETLEKYKDEVIKLNAEEKRILSVAIDLFSEIYGEPKKYEIDEIIYAETAKGVSSMMSNFSSAKEYRSHLIKEGEKKARKKAAKEKLETAKSLLDVLDIEIIAKKFNLTVKEVEELKEAIKSRRE